MFSESTGVLYPPRCRAWCCLACGPGKARRLARAVDAAGYDRWITVTNAPADLLQGVSRLAYLLRAGGSFEWVWSAEAGEDTGMRHVHACVRSPYVPQRALVAAARRAGWGRVAWIESGRGRAGRYAAKAAGYAGKEAASYVPWLELNGGRRPWHWSRHYTLGLPMRDFVKCYAPAKDKGPFVALYPRQVPADAIDAVRDALVSIACGR